MIRRRFLFSLSSFLRLTLTYIFLLWLKNRFRCQVVSYVGTRLNGLKSTELNINNIPGKEKWRDILQTNVEYALHYSNIAVDHARS